MIGLIAVFEKVADHMKNKTGSKLECVGILR